jgi:hypothetical protein
MSLVLLGGISGCPSSEPPKKITPPGADGSKDKAPEKDKK